MTEAEWLACTDPTPMLEFLRGKASDRKLLLFVSLCLGERFLGAEVVERYADGVVGSAEMAALRASIPRRNPEDMASLPRLGPDDNEVQAMYRAVTASAHDAARRASSAAWKSAALSGWMDGTMSGYGGDDWEGLQERYPEQEWLRQANLLRDIFGNPFRPASLDPSWLTPTVVSLATGAYNERILPSGELDSARLSILADALEEAGCTESVILDHLRGPGPHVRGCFALDLVLGRE
jgi:hypothetical protein